MVKKEIYSGPVHYEGRNNLLLIKELDGVRDVYSSPMYHEGCQDHILSLGAVNLICKTDNCFIGPGRYLNLSIEGEDPNEVSEVENICVGLLPGRYCIGDAVVALVSYDDKILLGKKRADAGGFLSGEWHIPGETLEKGESDEAGLKRGIDEEAGIEISVLEYLASHRTPKHNLAKWYGCKALTCDIKPGSDLSEVRWIPRERVLEMCSDKAVSLWPQLVLEYLS